MLSIGSHPQAEHDNPLAAGRNQARIVIDQAVTETLPLIDDRGSALAAASVS
ncbi:MAG TPA: hypothetical protein VGV10_06745 [Thermoleophilaceae bacterium]|nr:hypothetical protein [Thermoleophilaceae bacterium]